MGLNNGQSVSISAGLRCVTIKFEKPEFETKSSLRFLRLTLTRCLGEGRPVQAAALSRTAGTAKFLRGTSASKGNLSAWALSSRVIPREVRLAGLSGALLHRVLEIGEKRWELIFAHQLVPCLHRPQVASSCSGAALRAASMEYPCLIPSIVSTSSISYCNSRLQ